MTKKFKTAVVEIKLIIEVPIYAEEGHHKGIGEAITLAHKELKISYGGDDDFQYCSYNKDIKVLGWEDTPVEDQQDITPCESLVDVGDDAREGYAYQPCQRAE